MKFESSKNYGVQIKWYRKKNHYTISQVSEITNISEPTLIAYESGKKTIPISAFIALSRLYGFDVFSVMGVRNGENEHNIKELEYDISYYYLLRVHCEFKLQEEKKANELFGSVFPEGYYENRLKEYIKSELQSRIFNEYFEELKKEAEKDLGIL